MVNFESIVRDIKNIKIQGANNIAIAAAKALNIIVYENKGAGLLRQLDYAKGILFKSRPTEPAMRNVISYLTSDLGNFDNIVEEFQKRQEYVQNHFKETKEKVGRIGAKKIKKGDVVYTHCHSSFVMEILKQAKKEKKEFELYNTETRPLFQGRITAREAARLGIPVRHFVDSAARLALKEADIMLIGADAITSEGKVINKIGSELFSQIADKYDVPIYVCTDSWKFDPLSIFGYEEEIEQRSAKEVWPTAPRGIRIDNAAFEKIDANLVSGVISEIGVYKPEVFVQEVKKEYPWII